jgi:hypothetical protein
LFKKTHLTSHHHAETKLVSVAGRASPGTRGGHGAGPQLRRVRLTFTAANWDRPQTATISAAADSDTSDDLATFSVTAPGLATETVTVHARDEIAAPPPADDAGAPPVADAGVPDATVAAADGPTDAAADAAAGDGPAADGSADRPVATADAASDLRIAPAVVDMAAGTGGSVGTGGTGGAGGTGGSVASKSSSGCGCHLGGRGETGGAALVSLLAGLVLRRRTR